MRDQCINVNTNFLGHDAVDLEPIPIAEALGCKEKGGALVEQQLEASYHAMFPQKSKSNSKAVMPGFCSSSDLYGLKPISPLIEGLGQYNLGESQAIAHEDEAESTDCSSSSSEGKGTVYTLHQAGKWQERFEDLIAFKNEYGHCCVPSHWPQNPPLAQWVKRQRSQWKLKREFKHSNMTDEREQVLEHAGFIWDSHSVLWEERLGDLKEFVRENGHANIPSRYPANPQLAIWCKCQRRQFKLFSQGDKRSNMSAERLRKLLDVGFVFDPRKLKHLKGMR